MRLTGDVPAAVNAARSLGRVPEAVTLSGTLILPLRNQAELDQLLRRLHDPLDSLYGRYLTPAEFAARFSPTASDYAAALRYAQTQGLTVTATHTNRLLLDVSGPARAVEAAFGVQVNSYQSAAGKVFHAPNAAPSVPRSLAGVVTGIAGLSDATVRHPHKVRLSETATRQADVTGQQALGTGPAGGLAPQDIKTAYGLGSTSLTGSGQTLALFELDGYGASDIAAYESQFGLPSVPLENVLLNTATGTAGANTDEVTLDIELQIALAPGASKILVYETGDTDAEVLDAYSQIAEDDQAKQISTSWGLDEPESASSTLQAENAIFEQMAAQGQTIYAATGDSGAYDTGSRQGGLAVDDPASQPYVCGVGGTTLTTTGTGGTYVSETTWNSGSVQNGAGGGGISSVWPIPSWQQAAVSSASLGSTTMRNVPDISLNADPNSGYSIYVQGAWAVYGGTSCAAPLWAGFTALVNQQRTANGLSELGQASPVLYPLLASTRYAEDFHDIADSSTNLYYPAVSGYDDATGLGTFDGVNLIKDLAGETAAAVPAAPTALTATAGIRQVVLAWAASTGAASYNVYRSQTSGSGYVKVGVSTGVSYTDAGLTNGTKYFYVVTAVSSAGESALSNEASATPAAAVATFAAGIQFISLPYDYSSVALPTLFGYSSVSLFVWNPALDQYVVTPNAPADHIRLGQGYWVRFPAATTVTLQGTPAATSADFTMALSAGWDQIGDPFSTTISVSQFKVIAGTQSYALAAAQNKGIVGASLYRYDTGTGSYAVVGASDTLQPGQGYWIYIAENVTLDIPHP